MDVQPKPPFQIVAEKLLWPLLISAGVFIFFYF
jgi:hypothetical protein